MPPRCGWPNNSQLSSGNNESIRTVNYVVSANVKRQPEVEPCSLASAAYCWPPWGLFLEGRQQSLRYSMEWAEAHQFAGMAPHQTMDVWKPSVLGTGPVPPSTSPIVSGYFWLMWPTGFASVRLRFSTGSGPCQSWFSPSNDVAKRDNLDEAHPDGFSPPKFV